MTVMEFGNPRPNFFIVGTAKSGTSSLAKYLGQHPEIFMPPWEKEPAYFADHTGHSRWEDYQRDFEGAESYRVAGEKSVAHLYDARAAEKIRRFNPRARIIISLRHPVDMAYSLYLHNRRNGYERLPSFAAALAAEDQRAADPDFPRSSHGYYANLLYRRRATYYPQVKRYIDCFGRNQVLLLRFSDLQFDALAVCRRIFHFLGVDEEFVPDLTPENVTVAARIQVLQDWYVHHEMLRNVIVKTVPRPLRKLAYQMNNQPLTKRRLTPSERAEYSKLFEEDLRHIEQEYAIRVA